MATVRQEFDMGAALRGLYEDLPYVRKVGYVVGEWGGRLLVRVLVDEKCDFGEFFARTMEAVKRALEFRDMLPADIRSAYEVVPIVTDVEGEAVDNFRNKVTVLERWPRGGGEAHT